MPVEPARPVDYLVTPPLQASSPLGRQMAGVSTHCGEARPARVTAAAWQPTPSRAPAARRALIGRRVGRMTYRCWRRQWEEGVGGREYLISCIFMRRGINSSLAQGWGHKPKGTNTLTLVPHSTLTTRRIYTPSYTTPDSWDFPILPLQATSAQTHTTNKVGFSSYLSQFLWDISTVFSPYSKQLLCPYAC